MNSTTKAQTTFGLMLVEKYIISVIAGFIIKCQLFSGDHWGYGGIWLYHGIHSNIFQAFQKTKG
jgi:hypothetical protein